jgi:hypothetical protein
MVFLVFSSLNLYFVGNLSCAGIKVWHQDAMFVTHLFLQGKGMTTILLKKMLIFGSLTHQNPTGGYPGSQLPWHCSSSS